MNRLTATLHSLFDTQAARTPTAVAVVSAGGALSYAELDAKATALAGQIAAVHGVGPGQIVALCAERSLAQMIGLLALLKTGAACLPLDPAYPAELLEFMLRDSQAALVLTQSSLLDRLPATDTPRWCLDQTPASSASSQSTPAAEAHLAYLIYTSGSTGRPKGVAMPHRALANLLEWHRRTLPLTAGDRVLQFSPLSFDVSFQEIFSTWAEGGTLVLVEDALRRDPRALWRHLCAERITRLFLPFVALQQLTEAAPPTEASSLREVITAGEQLRVTPQLRAFFSRHPQTSLHNHYGPSETHVITAYPLPGPATDWPALPSIGRPIDHSEVRLLDENLQPVPTGEPGEMILGGICLADGYHARPELNAERFITLDGARFYRSGDLARELPDGTLEYLGRRDDQVKIRGFRVELGEVEAALSLHPGIRECAVVAREQRLLAYYIGETLDPKFLREFLAIRLTPQAVPSVFTKLEAMPLTPSGKINRRALPDPVAETAPELPAETLSPTENVVSQVWSEVLELPQPRLDENFFDLGGTSLSIVRVQQLLHVRTQRELPIAILFQHSTIRALARYLDTDSGASLREQTQSRAAQQRAALARRAPVTLRS